MKKRSAVKVKISDKVQCCISALMVILLVIGKIVEAIFLIALVILLLPFVLVEMIFDEDRR